MAKRRSSRKQASLSQQILGLLIILIAAIVVYAFGVDPEQFGIEDIFGDTTDNGGTEEEVSSASGSWYQVYFTNPVNSNDPSLHTGAEIEKALIRYIDGAKSTIDTALFELDAPETTAALIRALDRGVKIRMVVDNEHTMEAPDSTIDQVIQAGASVIDDGRGALMHNKYFIIDSTYVWTGATNITRNGLYNNNNNAIVIQSQKLVENYQADFEEMFTDGNFTRSADSRSVPNQTFTLESTQIETYFAPEDGALIEQRLVELMTNAKSSIRIMTFSFTLDSVGNAIIGRMKNGVTMEGIFETTGSLVEEGEMRPIACAGGTVRQDGNPSIFHHKVFIIDEQIVVTGSFNFSANARDSNSENMLIIHNADIARAYMSEFRARFNEGRVPSSSDLGC